jgi:hypothetical protein
VWAIAVALVVVVVALLLLFAPAFGRSSRPAQPVAAENTPPSGEPDAAKDS